MSYSQRDDEFEFDNRTCPKCGERVLKEAGYCLECGCKVERVNTSIDTPWQEHSILNEVNQKQDDVKTEPQIVYKSVPISQTFFQKMLLPIAGVLCVLVLVLTVALIVTASKQKDITINENTVKEYREYIPKLLSAFEEEKNDFFYFYASDNLFVMDKNSRSRPLVIYTLKKDSHYYMDLMGDSVTVKWGEWIKSKNGGYENTLTITPVKPGWSQLEFYERDSDDRLIVKAFVY